VGGPPAWGLGETNDPPPEYSISVKKHYSQHLNRTDYLAQPKHRKMDMRFGTLNVRSLCR
jgi:hypothetical protein